MTEERSDRPSLEALVEDGDLSIEVLHPGGLETTRRLVALCGIRAGTRVLDVACGTGESACFLAEVVGAEVTGVDASERMVERARRKAEGRSLAIRFEKGDAHGLPFPDGAFDAVIAECTLSLLDKEKALGEMVRVARFGGRVAIHDICWKEGASLEVRRRLAELEGEFPETLEGWRSLFAGAGLRSVEAVDLSGLVPRWMRETQRQLGWKGQLRLAARVLRRWGAGGLWRVLQSLRIFRDPDLGYVMVVGTKP